MPALPDVLIEPRTVSSGPAVGRKRAPPYLVGAFLAGIAVLVGSSLAASFQGADSVFRHVVELLAAPAIAFLSAGLGYYFGRNSVSAVGGGEHNPDNGLADQELRESEAYLRASLASLEYARTQAARLHRSEGVRVSQGDPASLSRHSVV